MSNAKDGTPIADLNEKGQSLAKMIQELRPTADPVTLESSDDWSDIFDDRHGEWPKNWSKLKPVF